MIKNHTSSAAKFSLTVFVLALTSLFTNAQDIPTDAAVISQGKALFDTNCKSCHAVKKEKVGPALAGVVERAPSVNWIKDWVHNSAKVIASGDDYGNKLYVKYNKSQMTAFTTLKDEQILAILAHIKAEESVADAAAVPGDTTQQKGTGDGVPSTYLNVILVGMILILVLLLIILVFIVATLKGVLDQRNLSEEEKEVVHSPITFNTFIRSTGFIFVVAFIVAGLGFKAVINGLYSIGVQQGYAPKQPIAFSHKIHAGDLEIDCKYCHTGAMKNKNATIPTVNICMNCHNQVKEGSQTGTGEIAKILFAYENNKPIEWVRIHNLPDLAYFNHAQHVNVAGVECQTCHGPIQEMDVVRQHALLTMGWCVDCHRKTDINAEGNAYYDKLVEIHKKSKKAPMKVEDNGGLECAKCHY